MKGLVIFSLLMLSVSIAIVHEAYAYDPGTARLPTWSPPEIAKCDKPLWDRIQDGC